MSYRVVVAIPTFKRHEAIREAASAVLRQIDELRATNPDVVGSVLVVDNDPAGSAHAVVAPLGVDYVCEPRPGIAAVRNRSFDESGECDALIFIDDDELPKDGWLETLITRHRTSGADAVAGRVLTEFPPHTEPWVRASGAFIRPQRVDNQRMAEAATNNLLLDMPRVRRIGLRFDEAFGLTGGSDSLFTRQLSAAGGTILWAQEAVVVEREDPGRFRKAWVLMRAFRFGNTGSRVELALASGRLPRLRVRARGLIRGLARVLAGSSRAVWGTLTGSLKHRARGVRTVYRGAGMIAGSVGYAFNEYGRRRQA